MRVNYAELNVGSPVQASGYFTQASFFHGVNGSTIEHRIGYKPGRLGLGWLLLFMTKVPMLEQFELRGYSQLSDGVEFGHVRDGPSVDELSSADPDSHKIKKQNALGVFTLQGWKRLARVVPIRPEFGDGIQYPPGTGIPQWTSAPDVRLDYVVAARVKPGGMYTGGFS